MRRAVSQSRPRAILFDMDGTITRPLLDFDAIRRELRLHGPILEALRHLEGERLAEAHRILDRHERTAAENSELNAGCDALLRWLEENDHRTALITRNSRSSTEIILNRHALTFDLVHTREDGPPKPDPHALRHAVSVLGCSLDESWMVGDGSHDIEAAAAAGIHSVWISHRTDRRFNAVPDVTIDALEELLPILQAMEHSPERFKRV